MIKNDKKTDQIKESVYLFNFIIIKDSEIDIITQFSNGYFNFKQL